MIHCFSLIHDDLPCMDDDDFRRGRPSNHKVFGEGMALLSGDALMACASDTLLMSAQAGIAPTHVLSAIKRFNWASGPQGVIGGQAMEPLLAEQPSLDFLERMFAGKTGALFVASLLLPLDLSGISETSREGGAIASFARELGYAFQVADDLEDALEPGSREHEKPHSIVYHLPIPDAARRTHLRLARATDDLRTVYGARAAHLASIAGEVLKKLDRYQNS
jgi:geranylgeranyl diphosphate synthase type II